MTAEHLNMIGLIFLLPRLNWIKWNVLHIETSPIYSPAIKRRSNHFGICLPGPAVAIYPTKEHCCIQYIEKYLCIGRIILQVNLESSFVKMLRVYVLPEVLSMIWLGFLKEYQFVNRIKNYFPIRTNKRWSILLVRLLMLRLYYIFFDKCHI